MATSAYTVAPLHAALRISTTSGDANDIIRPLSIQPWARPRGCAYFLEVPGRSLRSERQPSPGQRPDGERQYPCDCQGQGQPDMIQLAHDFVSIYSGCVQTCKLLVHATVRRRGSRLPLSKEGLIQTRMHCAADWMERAEEAKFLAERFDDGFMRDQLLEIAESYDRLVTMAVRAELREASLS